MPAFKDIAKSCKDLLYGKDFSTDSSLSVGTKTASGLTITAKGTKKGDAGSGEVTGAYKVYQGVSLETTVNSASKINAKVGLDDLAPGLKVTLSGSIPDKKSGKVEAEYKAGPVNLKADVGMNGAPKLEANSALKVVDNLVAGGEVGYDVSKSAVSKYNFGAAYSTKEFDAAAIVENKLDTVKLSYVHNLGAGTTVGAEVARKLSKGSTSVTLGGEKKLEGNATAKGKIDSLGAVSLSYSQTLKPKTNVTFATAFDANNLDKAPKVGINFAIKP